MYLYMYGSCSLPKRSSHCRTDPLYPARRAADLLFPSLKAGLSAAITTAGLL